MRLLFLLIALSTSGWCSSAPELVLQLGHEGSISQAVMSPSGQTIATVGEDGQTILWNTSTGEQRATFEGSHMHRIAFSPDGRFLLGSGYRAMQKWDAVSGRLVHTFPTRGAGVFSPDTSRLATFISISGMNSIEIWDTATGATLPPLRTKPAPNYSSTIAWSPDGSTLAAADYNGSLHLWNIADSAHIRTINFRPFKPAGAAKDENDIHGAALQTLTFSGDGKWVAAAGPGAVRLADVETGRIFRKLGLGKTYERHLELKFSRDGKLLYAATQGNAVRIWDTQTAKLKGHLASTRHVKSMSFAAKVSNLLLAGATPRLGLWDATTNQPQRIFHGVSQNRPSLRSLTVSPDGRYVLAHAWREGHRLWDLQTPSKRLIGASGRWIPGEPAMFVSAHEKLFEWYRVPGGELWKRVEIPTPEPPKTPTKEGEVRRRHDWELHLQAHAISSDGKLLAGFTRGEIFLYEARTGKLLRTLPGRAEPTTAAVFSPDGKYLAAGGGEEHGWGDEKGSVSLWGLRSKNSAPKLFLAHNGVQSLAWSPDSSTLAIGCGNAEGYDEWGEIQLVDAAQLKLQRYLLGHKSPVGSLAWGQSAAGAPVLLASSRRDVKAWRLPAKAEKKATSEQIQPLWSSDRGAHTLHTWRGNTNFLQADHRGTIEIRDIQTDTLRGTLMSLPSDRAPGTPGGSPHWIIFTPQGYYTGSANCEKWIRWRVDGKIHPAAKFKSQFHRPDKVRQALQLTG